jgi:hypothetical protein
MIAPRRNHPGRNRLAAWVAALSVSLPSTHDRVQPSPDYLYTAMHGQDRQAANRARRCSNIAAHAVNRDCSRREQAAKPGEIDIATAHQHPDAFAAQA